jgi:hypothetical protein
MRERRTSPGWVCKLCSKKNDSSVLNCQICGRSKDYKLPKELKERILGNTFGKENQENVNDDLKTPFWVVGLIVGVLAMYIIPVLLMSGQYGDEMDSNDEAVEASFVGGSYARDGEDGGFWQRFKCLIFSALKPFAESIVSSCKQCSSDRHFSD